MTDEKRDEFALFYAVYNKRKSLKGEEE